MAFDSSRLLEELSFGEAGACTDPVFVDEFDLPKRTEWEQGGAPDQSLQDQSRSDRSPRHRDLVHALEDVLDGLSTKWSVWRAERLEAGVLVGPPPADPSRDALDLAQLTATDHQQRALNFAPGSLEELQGLRLAVLQRIEASGDPTLLHVVPWLWRWASLGQPLTNAGRETGYELRLSWYKKPQV